MQNSLLLNLRVLSKIGVLTTLFVAISAFATIRPIASASLGLDFANFHQAQNIVLFAPYTNTYFSYTSDNQPVGSLFLGIESSIYQDIFGQLGLSYYQTNHLSPDGTVYQFAQATMDNLYYDYKIDSRRLMVEGKLLFTKNHFLHPYVSLGLGSANNRSYNYHETPATSADVPMQYVFANRTYHSFTYALGVGADYDIAPNIRIGGGYRFANIGKAGLGTISMQDSTTTIKYTHINLNEVLFQVTLLG